MYTYVRVGEWVVDFHGDVDKSGTGFNHEFSISLIPGSPFRFQVLDFLFKFYFNGYHGRKFHVIICPSKFLI